MMMGDSELELGLDGQHSLSSLLAAYGQAEEQQQQQQHGPTPVNEEDLKAWIVSPSTASVASPQPQEDTKVDGAVFAPSSSLESALSALGESGRQQLLAILQLANGHGRTGPNSGASLHPTLENAPGATAGQAGTSTLGPSPQSAHESSKKLKKGSDHRATASNLKKRKSQAMYDLSGSSENPMSPNTFAPHPHSGGTLPAYFANAFSQYSQAHSQASVIRHAGASAGASADGGSGSTPSSGSSKPSPALSAVTSYSTASRQGAAAPSGRQGSAGTSFSNPIRISGGAAGTAASRHTPSNSTTGLEGMHFRLPDANYYRSPAMAPGTSSSAFYTDSGLGEDSDLLFTPLLSPALTPASTQPGPSVGPLPETFAQLGKDSLSLSAVSLAQQGHGGSSHYSGSTGISPLNTITPLTSPALQPQGARSAAASPRHTSHQHHHHQQPRRGASKNLPKVRPSPILRPSDQQSLPSHNSHTSGRSSKRNSLSSLPALHTNALTSPANSVPPSPAQPNYNTPFGLPQSTMVMPKIHEHAAQAALKDSPSPHQFDLSSANSAASMLANAIQQQNAYLAQHSNQQQLVDPQTALQSLFTAQQQQHSIPASNNSFSSASADYQQSQEAAAQLALGSAPSPLDLNSFFGMLHGAGQTQGVSPESDHSKPVTQQHAYGISNNTSGATSQGATRLAAPSQYDQPFAHIKNSAAMDAPDYASFLAALNGSASGAANATQQAQAQAQLQALISQQQLNAFTHPSLYPSPTVSPALARLLQQPVQPGYAGSEMPFSIATTNSAEGSTPLTPAAFMNLTQNRLDFLTGLQADQSQGQKHGQPFHAASGPDATSDNHGKARSSQPGSKRASATTSPVFAPDQSLGDISAAQQQKFMLPPSPAIVAQSIKEAAAAAIAAKEAKSAAKGRGAGRKKALAAAAAAGGEASHPAAKERKTGKRAAAQAAESAVRADASHEDAMDFTGGLDGSIAPPSNPFATSAGAGSAEQSPVLAPENRKSSHKIAEQRRRDSLKLCFEELRFILPPINPDEDEDFAGKRPGENNVGGQRGKAHNVDPKHPNKGISKVALLRKSNEYVTKLHERVDKRDLAIQILREELRACRSALGQGLATDPASLDALSAVDWADLDADQDSVLPTYKITGICGAVGSSLTYYKPSQPTISEETGNDEEMRGPEENEEEEDEEVHDDGEEYKAKRTKRTLSTSGGPNTRRSVKA